MPCLMHVEGWVVPAGKVPKSKQGPELYKQVGEFFHGVFPINDNEVLVGK